MARIVLAACSRSSAGSRISMSAPRRRKSASAARPVPRSGV